MLGRVDSRRGPETLTLRFGLELVKHVARGIEAIDGYAQVRGEISDDLAIARALKKAGFREVFLDIRRLVRCRMYEGYRASFNGLSKNIYDIARHRSVLFAVAVTLLVTFVVSPLALLPIGLSGRESVSQTVEPVKHAGHQRLQLHLRGEDFRQGLENQR